MFNQIKAVLEKQKIETFEIRKAQKECMELYFIWQNLSMKRRIKICKYYVNVYCDWHDEERTYRGKSTVVITDGMDIETLEEKIKEAYFSASLDKRYFYPITTLELSQRADKSDTNTCPENWENQAFVFANAAFEADIEKIASIRLMEIFSSKYTMQYVNSNGVDVSYTEPRILSGISVQCHKPQKTDISVLLEYEQLEPSIIKNDVKDIFDVLSQRGEAVQRTVSGTYRLILFGYHVMIFMNYFRNQGNLDSNEGHHIVGQDIQMIGSQEEVTGDRLNMILKADRPYSNEGIAMKDRVLFENGILKTLYGSMSACYSRRCEPTGEYRKIEVAPGSWTLEEMKQEPYLYVKEFLRFHMDDVSREFYGEIRTAYQYDGNTVISVTGGSVRGSIVNAKKNMRFSKEVQDDIDYHGPLAVCIENVTVAGA